MVAVDSPYSVLPKGFPKVFGDVSPSLALDRASREPRSEQESLPTISNLGSWNGLLTRLPAGFISATASAFALRNSAALTSDLVFKGRPALSLRACPAPDQTVLGQLRSGAPSNPSIFQRYPCSHYGRLRVVQPFRGIALIGSCAPRPEQLQVYRSSKFCASYSRSVTWRTLPLESSPFTILSAGELSTRKPLGHLPSPEDGPRTPTGQSLASENAPFGAVPRATPR
jgi:hypothetical protein